MWGSQSQQSWNQWAIQPSMFSNVPHDERNLVTCPMDAHRHMVGSTFKKDGEVDWAELAKQWIQMQQTQPVQDTVPPPLPQEPPSGPPAPGPLFGPEEYAPKLPSPPQVNSHTVLPEPFASCGGDMGKPSDIRIEPGGPYPPHDSGNSYWQQDWDIRAAASDIDERVWAPPPPAAVPPPPPVDIPPPMLPNEKKTFDYGHVNDAPQLAMQTVDYNHMSDHYPYNQLYPAPPPEDPYDHYWSQVASAPMIPAPFLKKERPSNYQATTEEEAPQIDAAKRKQLPAWIREGLEKMEQERLKRLEKERAEKEKAERAKKAFQSTPEKDATGSGPYGGTAAELSKSKFDTDSESEAEQQPAEGSVAPNEMHASREASPADFRTEEEKQHELMLKVRRILTEILLDVTNEEMANIAREVYQKARSKAPARPLASPSALRSVTSGLSSLASYDSPSEASASDDEEDSSTSDEELMRRIQEKKRQFALKERKILAELEQIEEERRQRKTKIAEGSTVYASKPEVEAQGGGSLVKPGTETASSDSVQVKVSDSQSEASKTSPPRPEGPEEPPSIVIPGLTPPSVTAEDSPEHYAQETENVAQENTAVEHAAEHLGPFPLHEDGSAKSRSMSSSSDTESDSFSSESSYSHSDKSPSRSRKREHTRSKKHSRVKKNKNRHRSSSSHVKHGRSKNSRRGSSVSSRENSKSQYREKYKQERSRTKSKAKPKVRDVSLSSVSSASSEHSKERPHDLNEIRRHSPERQRRRSWSYDRRSRHHKSRSLSRSSRAKSPSDLKHEYHDSYQSRSSSRYYEESRGSRKDHRHRSRSLSPSRTPKRYKRKSRSRSVERGRYVKKSKIRSYDR